jgi:hypothetical protein
MEPPRAGHGLAQGPERSVWRYSKNLRQELNGDRPFGEDGL